jgi:hypothetical protein
LALASRHSTAGCSAANSQPDAGAKSVPLTHPVDILIDLGVKFSPAQEANARAICDKEVEGK